MNLYKSILLNFTNEGGLAIHNGMDASEGHYVERDELVLAGNRLLYSTYKEDPRQLHSLQQRAGQWLSGIGKENQGVAGLLIVWMMLGL